MKYQIYTDEELKPFFHEMSIGFTYKEATANIGYDINRIESTMNDLEVRCYMLDVSMAGYHTGWRKGKYYPEHDERINNDEQT